MKTLLLSLFLLSGSLSLIAQPGPGPDRERKIKALYIAYVSEKLILTEDEAQKFWPVHTQYENEVKGVKSDLPELDRQQSILNIKKKYQDRFIKILGNSRTDDFFRIDAEFKKKLVDHLKNMRENGGQRPFRRNSP